MAGLVELLDQALKRVFGSAKLRPYETAVVEAWEDQISDDARAVLQEQLERYDYVQRQAADKVTCFFCIRDRECRTWPTDALFPLRTTEEITVARVVLARTDGRTKTRLEASVVMGDGRLLSIDFNARPATIFARNVRRQGVAVVDVDLLVDPMSPDPYATEPLTDMTQLKGWLHELADRWQLSDLRQPLSPRDRSELVRRLESTLPPDYLELVAQTEGVTVGHCKINGLSQVWTLPWPDDSFHVIAEVEDRGTLGVRQGDRDGLIHFLGNEEDQAEAVGTSLRAVVERELQLAERAGDGTD